MALSVSALLKQLEQQLKNDRQWATKKPGQDMLASVQPFAIDTLTIAQWLQFIFLPKMNALIDQNQPLPTKMKIAPIIEQTYSGNKFALTKIVEQIEQFCADNKRPNRAQ